MNAGATITRRFIMRHTSWTPFKLIAAASLLPLSGFMQLAHADAPATPTIVVAAKPKLAANDCVSLAVQRHTLRRSGNGTTPVLVNRCDYPVVVSYCIDDAGNASIACDAGDAKPASTQRLAAHQTLALDTHGAMLADNEVNWVACRSMPGVSSRLIDGGSSGQCRAPAPVMQALAQQTQ
jgi:hypothetical protein